jgi:hypothetical protein
MVNLLIWVLMFIPALFIELACYILAPVVALFVTRRPREDRVKRLGNQVLTMDHDYIIKPLYWFQTHDNAVDEWWYGVYNEDHWFKFAREATQEDYDNKAWFRWYCRVMWMWRNCAYGFHYNLFSRPLEEFTKVYTKGEEEKGFWYLLQVAPKSFKLEVQIPISKKRYYSANVGWKSHKGFPKVLYANRIISFRKY